MSTAGRSGGVHGRAPCLSSPKPRRLEQLMLVVVHQDLEHTLSLSLSLLSRSRNRRLRVASPVDLPHRLFLIFYTPAALPWTDSSLNIGGFRADGVMDHLGLRGHHSNDLFLMLLLLPLAFNIACSEVATLTADTFSEKVPVKTPKADLISKDLVRRGFRGVGPTVIYSFMQTAGMTNDRLISCHRFEEYCAASNRTAQVGGSCMNGEMAEVTEIGDDIGEKRMDDDLI